MDAGKRNDRHSRIRRRVGAVCVAVVCLMNGIVCTPVAVDDQPSWQLVLEDLPGGLLSVSGTSGRDVYAVGTDPGDGLGPLIVRYDGEEWTRLASGASGDLWWISDRPLGNSFFMTGESGLILRYHLPEVLPGLPETSKRKQWVGTTTDHEVGVGEFEVLSTPGAETIYGVWGGEVDDVYAVGGNGGDFDHGGVVWHFDGNEWSTVDLSSLDPDGLPVLFKIWGRSRSEIYAVGARGVILEFDGSAWRLLASPTTRTLFGLYGDESIVVACGGAQGGVILRNTGEGFQDVTPSGALQMNGASVTPAGAAFTVGREGAVAANTAGAWGNWETALNLDPVLHFHGPWSDPDGGIWAVGGNLDGQPVDAGMIVYYGPDTISTTMHE